jgi:hypothetical protein
MAEIIRSAGRSTYIRTSPCNTLTTWEVREFVRALNEAAIPDGEPVICGHDDSTSKLQSLSVRYDESIDGWPNEKENSNE